MITCFCFQGIAIVHTAYSLGKYNHFCAGVDVKLGVGDMHWLDNFAYDSSQSRRNQLDTIDQEIESECVAVILNVDNFEP